MTFCRQEECNIYINDSKEFPRGTKYEIENLFLEIVNMKNRIIHGFRITSKQGEQVLATKTLKKDGNAQFEITIEYLMDFIKKNEKLSDLLHEYRGY